MKLSRNLYKIFKANPLQETEIHKARHTNTRKLSHLKERISSWDKAIWEKAWTLEDHHLEEDSLRDITSEAFDFFEETIILFHIKYLS